MRVLKRRKGNKDYFYLQTSFREDGKVITREKYLGEKMPKDIEKIKEALDEERKEFLYNKLNKIKESFQNQSRRKKKSR